MKVRKITICKKDRQGQRSKWCSTKWYAVWVDYSQTLRRLPLFEDRKASDECARKIARLDQLRGAGDSLPSELARYVETMPPRLRAKLAKWGILSSTKVAASQPLSAHLQQWRATLLAKGNTARHAELVTSRAQKAFDGCGFKFWTDISASKLQCHLAELCQERPERKGISAQTHNFYLQACKQFCRWMVRDGRASESPLAHLQGLNVRTDRRHDRKALSTDELLWLLDTTAHATERWGMAGQDRAMLYRLAVETGLRASELRSLTRASFNLDASEPSVTIAAAYAKNRRQDILPLKVDTAGLLGERLADKMPAASAFNMPVRTEVIRMFRADLNDARSAWLQQARSPQELQERKDSAFLAERDNSGHFADFHALRHTFITSLVLGGVNPKMAQQLARHSVITLTLDRYTHLHPDSLSAALEVLPDLSQPAPQAAVATGTDIAIVPNCLSPSLSPDSGVRRNKAEPAANTMTKAELTTIKAQPGRATEKPLNLTDSSIAANLLEESRRSGRAAECAGLENR